MSAPSAEAPTAFTALTNIVLVPLTPAYLTTQNLDPDCPICVEPLTSPVKLPFCGHVFDEACIKQWLSAPGARPNTTCPMCRQPVESPADRKARKRMVRQLLRTRYTKAKMVDLFYEDDERPAWPFVISDVALVVAALRHAHQWYDEVAGYMAEATEGDAWFVNNHAVARQVREAMVACVEALPVGTTLDIDRFECRLAEAGQQGFQPEEVEALEDDDGFRTFRWQTMQEVIYESLMLWVPVLV